MRLFSYCIPVDDGAAPNPFWGICTLAICKPRIRSVAQKGDWIIGTGSKNVNGHNYFGKLVYAMRVSDVMTMKEYDSFCLKHLKEKIPDIKNKDYSRRVGDCIYDFSGRGKEKQREGVHNPGNHNTDINGKNVLLSNHFYYFGDQAIDLPEDFYPIIKDGQGHKSNYNNAYAKAFIDWIETQKYAFNVLHGKPQIEIVFNEKNGCISADKRCRAAEEDMAEEE